MCRPLEQVEGLPIDEVFIGTCTNGRYEDLEIAAQILKGKKVSPFTRTIVTPASVQIYDKAMKNGLIQIFHDAGCTIGVVGCGACIGRHGGLLGPGERAFTTMNRNFIGRMGSPSGDLSRQSGRCRSNSHRGKNHRPARISGKSLTTKSQGTQRF